MAAVLGAMGPATIIDIDGNATGATLGESSYDANPGATHEYYIASDAAILAEAPHAHAAPKSTTATATRH